MFVTTIGVDADLDRKPARIVSYGKEGKTVLLKYEDGSMIEAPADKVYKRK